MSWLRRFATRHRGVLAGILIVLVAVLAAANILKYFPQLRFGPVEPTQISAFSAALTASIVAAGAAYSYFHFFRGRTFSLKVELQVEISVVPLSDRNAYLHTVRVDVKNVGASTLWYPTVTIRSQAIGGEIETHDVTRWWVEHVGGKPTELEIIEAGEKQSFVLLKEHARSVDAVTYYCSCASQDGNEWYTARTAANRDRSAAEQATPSPPQ